MAKYSLVCKYCDHRWTEIYYLDPDDDYLRCPKCKDKNVEAEQKEEVDYYKEYGKK